MRTKLCFALVLGLFARAVTACGSDDAAQPTAEDGGSTVIPGSDAGVAADGAPLPADGGPGLLTCHATPRGDGPRKMLVTRPRSKEASGAYGSKGKTLEILDVAADGKLSRPGKTLEMAGSTEGIPSFTPDGAVAIVPLGGTAGLASLVFDAQGNASVATSSFAPEGKLYADRVVIDSTGSRAFVLDSNVDKNGGGIYEVRIACDGTLSLVGKVLASEKAAQLTWLGDQKGLYAGGLVGKTEDLHAFTIGQNPASAQASASLSVFGDGASVASSLGVTPDGKYAVVTDTGFEVGNRVGVVDLATFTTKQKLTVDAPEAFVVSPFGNAMMLVQSDTFDAYVPVTYAPDSPSPITLGTKITAAKKVELPTRPVVMKNGALKGFVYVVEVSGIRTLTFDAQGKLADAGLFSMDVDKDLLNAPFALGVQP